MHGLRHAYVHNRYEAITGWKPPGKGGPKRTELTPEQWEIDHAARLIISHETGHNREEITAVTSRLVNKPFTVNIYPGLKKNTVKLTCRISLHYVNIKR